MTITNSQAVEYGLIEMYAMNMYREEKSGKGLSVPARVVGEKWKLVGLIYGCDVIAGVEVLAKDGNDVFYGYVLQKEGEFVVAIRGTDGFVEWLEDGLFLPTLYETVDADPPAAPARDAPRILVEQGFWQIYRTLVLKPDTGDQGGEPGVVPLAAFVARHVLGAQRVIVVGHSLGAALATLLALELATTLRERLSACLFASPKVGNQAFADLFASRVTDYRLFNYILDIVPRVPFGPDYATLAGATILTPSAAESRIRFGPNCSHHVICYCAMLDYERVQREMPFIPDDEKESARCILGPEVGKPSISKVLASLIAHR